MILNFSTKDKQGRETRFIEKYFACSKKHTIRADRNNRWKAGRKIHITTGARTANYKLHALHVCRSVQPITIYFLHKGPPGIEIWIGEKKLTMEEMEILAINDGFEDIGGLFGWFCLAANGVEKVVHPRVKSRWMGKIIHWTDLKY